MIIANCYNLYKGKKKPPRRAAGRLFLTLNYIIVIEIVFKEPYITEFSASVLNSPAVTKLFAFTVALSLIISV